jgi:hypothetical protein
LSHYNEQYDFIVCHVLLWATLLLPPHSDGDWKQMAAFRMAEAETRGGHPENPTSSVVYLSLAGQGAHAHGQWTWKASGSCSACVSGHTLFPHLSSRGPLEDSGTFKELRMTMLILEWVTCNVIRSVPSMG